MSERAHTKGPWRVAKTTFGQTVIDAESIGEIVCRIEEWSPEQDEADARLIAAAPDMFEALKALLVVMDSGAQPRKLDEALTWRQNDEKARAMAIAALSKASVEVDHG